jgi:hypothetical protein
MSKRRISSGSIKRSVKPSTVPARIADPDDVLTPQEEALVTKARGQLRGGEGVNLSDLDHALDRHAFKGSRKTA